MWWPLSTSDRLKLVPSGREERTSVQTRSTRAVAARDVAATGMPWRSSSSTHPLVTWASDAAMPSIPAPSMTARVSTCSASTARCNVSYCSARIRVNTASVIAMNGTG